MNIYMLTRWGNGTDEDGPDCSSDTHMIVRAENLDRASEIADPLLLRLPMCAPGGRPVQEFTHSAALLGFTENPKESEGIICWPWYSFSPPQNCTSMWVRDSIADGWHTYEEYYGEPPCPGTNA